MDSFRGGENDGEGPLLCKSWLEPSLCRPAPIQLPEDNSRQSTSHLHPIRTLATNRYECVLIAMGCAFQEHIGILIELVAAHRHEANAVEQKMPV